ncbi:MAG: HPF/RaiA family ribosome-associated protein [Planctomycetes bacterium]|nr:HPF/RaiA family ribosome-associated protein [Planctomycetota bacterium]
MKTVVSIPHHDYPARVRAFVEGKLQSLFDHYDRVISLRALCERQSAMHRVELVANVGHHATLVVDARADAFDAALEGALAKMARVLTRHKDRRIDRHRRVRGKR